MFRNYLKIAWRNITRQKWASLINIFGLAIGMTASILLYIYISYETSFDRFHENADQVYRITTNYEGRQSSKLPRTFHQMGELAKDQSPLVKEFCRVKNENSTISFGEDEFGSTTLMTDPSFVDFFTFPSERGDVVTALSDPSTIVLSSRMAERIFGETDPINQVIQVSKTCYDEELGRWTSRMDPVRVGAILAPMPSNTHLRFDALLSFEAYDPQWLETFSNDVFVFLQIEGKDPDLKSVTDLTEVFFEEFRAHGMHITHELQPLKDIHFGPSFGYDIGARGNRQLIIVFIIVAALIITIAVINFINLVTARSEKRAVEASIRKVSGAGRRDIMGQFLGESVLMSLLAFFAAMVLVEIFLSPFAELLNRSLSLSRMESLKLFFSLSGLVVLIGLASGLGPAWMFSRFQPAEIMRGQFRGGNRNPMLRIILVVIQFAISVILIISIITFNRQVNHMKNASLGFDSENAFVFWGLTPSLVSGYEALRAELLQNPQVLQVGSGQSAPGYQGSGQILRPSETPEGEEITISEYRVREGARETFGYELVAGRWFDFSRQTDLANFIVNESAVKAMGLTNPIGTEVIMWQRKGEIIGVTRDFHFGSLRNEIGPLVFTAYSPAFYNISLKISPENREETLDYVKEVFHGFDSNYPFTPSYLGERFREFYRQEEQNNTILNIASLLAVLIAMLGLLGLSSYIVMSRKKEIGIRKIHGASGLQIIAVLFRDIGRWVLLANLIAWPVAWLAMEQWLGTYPYRINISVWFLVFAGLLTMLVAGLTISGQTLRAARTNPVDALKAG